MKTELINQLRLAGEDPMWADHAEVPKALLLRAATELTNMREALEKISRSSRDESGCFYTNRENIAIARAALGETQ